MPKPLFNPANYLPSWANSQTQPMAAAIYFILRLLDEAPAVPVQLAALRKPATGGESMFVLGEIGGEGGTPPAEILHLLARLRGENASRPANILVRPSPKHAHPWLFLDDLPTSRAMALCKEFGGLVVETSVGNSQVRLLCDRDMSIGERGRAHAQQALQKRLQSDANSTSGEKWGRLPGFKNQKPGKGGAWTNLLYDTTGIQPRIEAARLLSLPPGGVCATGVASSLSLGGSVAGCDPTPTLSPRVSAVLSSSSDTRPHTKADFARDALAKPLPEASARQSGWRQEFADACHALRAGLPDSEIIAMLALRALERGKRRTLPEATRYAKHILSVALQHQERAA